jgi:tetratricopeptide (TPR) repeat protein
MPVRNWNNPQTFERFLMHAAGLNIVHGFEGRIIQSTWKDLFYNFWTFSKFFGENLAFFLPLFVTGVIACFSRLFFLFCIGGIMLLDLVFTLKVNPMGITDLQTGTAFAYGFSLLSGMGAYTVFSFFSQKRLLKIFVFAAVFALLIPPLHNLILTSLRNWNYFPQDSSEEFINSIPPESLVMTQSDDMNSLLIYQKVVENARPDVLHAVTQHLADRHYTDTLVKYNSSGFFGSEFLDLQAKLPDDGGGILINREMANSLISYNIASKGIFYEMGESAIDRDYYGFLIPDFPVFRLENNVKKSADQEQADKSLNQGIKQIDGSCSYWKERTDRWGRLFLSEIYNSLGVLMDKKGFRTQAMFAFKKAIEIYGDNARAFYNLGILAFSSGWNQEGILRVRHSLELLPGYKKAREAMEKYGEN